MGNCENLATKQDIKDLSDKIDELFYKIVVLEGVIAFLQALLENVIDTMRGVLDKLGFLLETLLGIEAKILGAISNLLASLFNLIAKLLGDKDGEILDLLKWVQQRLEMLSHDIQTIKSIVEYLGDIIKSIYQLAYDTHKIAELLEHLLDKFYQEWAKANYALVNQIENLRQELAKALTQLAQDIQKALQDIYNDLVKRLDNLYNALASYLGQYLPTMLGLLNTIRDYIEEVSHWLEARINEILDLLNNIKNSGVDVSEILARLEGLSGELAGAKIDISSAVGGVGQTILGAMQSDFGTGFALIAGLHEKLNALLAKEESVLIPRIYNILGGGAWFDSEGGFKGFNINPFSKLKEKYEELETENGSGTAEDLLTLPDYIENFMAAIYGRLGLQDYPITAPENIADQEPTTLSLPHLTRFQSWQTKQIDALFGQYPIQINIEDSDLVKTGGQKLEIKLPNVAESLAEIMGLLITTRGLADANVNIGTRTLSELGATRETVTKGYYKLEAVEEYLGYPLKRRTIPVPHFFTPHGEEAGEPVGSLSDFLQNGSTDLEIEDYVEGKGLEYKLTALMEAARIIKSHFWRPVDLDEGSFAAQMKSLLQRGEGATDKVDEAQGKDDDFDTYLEEIERGFTGKSGIKDATNPYGRPFEQRPKITEIGKQAPDDGEGGVL